MYNHTTEKCQKGLLAKIDTQKVRHLFDKLQALLPRNPFLYLISRKLKEKKYFYQLLKSFGYPAAVAFPGLSLRR